jgi:SagB-type dehydrogenase family enzyme
LIIPHFIQKDLAMSAAAYVFISAVFARSTFKYGDRGYRFILFEAGHLAQNATLTAQEMGLATTNVGGYSDRAIDRYLGVDGLNESVIYIMLLGQPEP